MKRGIFIIIFIAISFTGMTQKLFEPDFSKFPSESLQSAFSKEKVSFMSSEEQKLVFFMNLLRIEPQLFLDEVIKPYVAFSDLNVNNYVKSLYKDLSKASPTHPFFMREDLYEMANAHLIDIGKKGLTGHVGSNGKTFAKRAAPMLEKYETVSENVGLGFYSPLDNLIGLLIDDGVKDLGHRKAILSPNYNCVGVAIGQHKEFIYGCVMDFGYLAN